LRAARPVCASAARSVQRLQLFRHQPLLIMKRAGDAVGADDGEGRHDQHECSQCAEAERQLRTDFQFF
jgi:hypothetical protein